MNRLNDALGEINKINLKNNPEPLLIDDFFRSFLLIGDISYMRFDFDKALSFYLQARAFIKKHSFSNERLVENYSAMISMRLILLYYAMLDYKNVLNEVKNLSFQEQDKSYVEGQTLQEKLIELASYSLFELRSPEEFKNFVGNKMSSDLINKIMISALNFSKKIGDTDFIEKVLSILEPYYLESPFYLDLLEFQKSLYKKGSRNYLFALNRGLQSLQKGSYWQETYSKDHFLNEKRRAFLSLYSKDILEDLLKSNKKSDLSDAYLLSKNLLDEKLSYDAQSFYIASVASLRVQKYSESLTYIKEGIKKLENRNDYHMFLAQLVRVSHQMILMLAKVSQKDYRTYYSAVDDFMIKYPSSSHAKQFLYESAKMAYLKGDLNSARVRFEKVLSLYAKGETDPFGVSQNSLEYLLLLYGEFLKDSKEIDKGLLLAIQNIAYHIKDLKIQAKIMSKFYRLHYSIILKYIKTLTHDKKRNEAAESAYFWALNNTDNPSSQDLFLLSCQEYLNLKGWSTTLEKSKEFLERFPHSKLKYDVFYIMASAYDEKFQFIKAAKYYRKSTESELELESAPPKKDILLKAISYYESLKLYNDEAQTLNQLGDYLFKKGQHENGLSYKLKAANYYIRLKKYKDSKKLFNEVIHESKASTYYALKGRIGVIRGDSFLYKDKTKSLQKLCDTILLEVLKFNSKNTQLKSDLVTDVLSVSTLLKVETLENYLNKKSFSLTKNNSTWLMSHLNNIFYSLGKYDKYIIEKEFFDTYLGLIALYYRLQNIYRKTRHTQDDMHFTKQIDTIKARVKFFAHRASMVLKPNQDSFVESYRSIHSLIELNVNNYIESHLVEPKYNYDFALGHY